MDGQEPVITVPAYEPGPQWLCKNCGTFNIDGTTHCGECGFRQGYDPEVERPVVHGEIPAQVIAAETAAPSKAMLYLAAAQFVLTLAILGLLLPVVLRLYQNWPFQSPFEQQAHALGVELLTLQARIDSGMPKAEYDAMLGPLLGDEAAFKALFEARPERQRDSYQKLVQAAEFYKFAGNAWDTQLDTAALPASVRAVAGSKEADKTVKSYWDRATVNARDAMRDL
jgi:hypothetical protein